MKFPYTFFFVATSLVLTACQSSPTETVDSPVAQPGEREYAKMIRDSKPPTGPLHEVRDAVLSPVEAVVYAAQTAPDGYPGTFGMQVRNVGRDTGGFVYLNSELNYRDQINVSVRMQPSVVAYLARTYGENWLNDVIGEQIEVEGEAKRTTIWFNDSTDYYYYQTHIHVSRPDQFRIL